VRGYAERGFSVREDGIESTWLSGLVAAFSFMKACHEHLKTAVS
jgi:hypothetical protein